LIPVCGLLGAVFVRGVLKCLARRRIEICSVKVVVVAMVVVAEVVVKMEVARQDVSLL